VAGDGTAAMEGANMMIPSKLRLYVAGLVAVLLGMPLSERALAGPEDIVWSAIDLAAGIADAASHS
jgi:hypothetical protein